MSPKENKAELEQAAADFDRAMDSILDAETTLDLLQTLVIANQDTRIELGTDSPSAVLNALRSMQRDLKRAREAMERGAG